MPRFKNIYLQALTTIARALEKLLVVVPLPAAAALVPQEEDSPHQAWLVQQLSPVDGGLDQLDHLRGNDKKTSGRAAGAESDENLFELLFRPLSVGECHGRKLLDDKKWLFFAGLARRLVTREAALGVDLDREQVRLRLETRGVLAGEEGRILTQLGYGAGEV